MKVKTYGDLMETANATSNDKLKAMLREIFQSWCKDHGTGPFDPTSVYRWQNEPIAEINAGELMMTAFGLDAPEKRSSDRQKLSVEELRRKYPEGTVLELISMDDPQAPPAGTIGTVANVDDMGTIHMKWETGSSLGLCPEVDKFRVVKEV